MRKLATALLAVPVLAVVYASTAAAVARIVTPVGVGDRSRRAARRSGSSPPCRPTPTTATPVGDRSAADRGARSGRSSPRTATSTNPSRSSSAPRWTQRSVAARSRSSPSIAVAPRLGCRRPTSSRSRRKHRWAAGTYHTITVDAGALAAVGRAAGQPGPAAFLTRDDGGAPRSPRPSRSASASRVGDGLRDHVRPAGRPGVGRSRRPARARASTGTRDARRRPATAATDLHVHARRRRSAPNTRYRLVVDGVRDVDGVARRPARPRRSGRPRRPAVVRFRPRDDDDRRRRATRRSPSASPTADGPGGDEGGVHGHGRAASRSPGKVTFAEDDTVLVFVPAKALPYGAKVVMHGRRRRHAARDGVALLARHRRPVQDRRRSRADAAHRARSRPRGGGGRPAAAARSAAAAGASVETLLPAAHELHADRRLGHLGRLVLAARAAATSPPLKLDRGISSKVSRPYAKKLAVGGDCSHFIGGNPGDRLRRAGYTSYTLGREHRLPLREPALGASSGRTCFFQSEKSYQRRPLRQPDEREVRPRRDRRLGLATAGSAWSSTSTTPDRDHRSG